MITPLQLNRVLEKLEGYCPKVNLFFLNLAHRPDQKDPINFSLNLFLQIVINSEKDVEKNDWILPSHLFDAFKTLAPNLYELVGNGYLVVENNQIKATEKTVRLLCEALYQMHRNHTALSKDGNLLFQLSIPESIIKKGLALVRSFRFHITKPIAVTCEMGGEGATLLIGTVNLWKKEGIIYTEEQLCIHHFLDSQKGVVIIAKYGRKYHVYIAPYDPELEMHAPIYFLGAIE